MMELNLARVFGNLLLNDSVLQAPTAFFNVPDTVTTTIFPTLQTVVGTLVMLQSTKDGDTECYRRTSPTMPLTLRFVEVDWTPVFAAYSVVLITLL